LNTPNFNHPLELPGAHPLGQMILPPNYQTLHHDLPGSDNSEFYGDPITDYEFYDLPAGSFEDGMQLGSLPKPFIQTVRYIHRGISPKLLDEYVVLDKRVEKDVFDIHHIVKKSYVIEDHSVARELLPFNGAIKGTFDLLTTPQRVEDTFNVAKVGRRGHMLINLIPLDYAFHHHLIEKKPFDYRIDVRVRKNVMTQITIPELLMSFNIFNLQLRLQILSDFIKNNIEKCLHNISTCENADILLTRRRSLFMWTQMQEELMRIPLVAQEIHEDHPHLFEIWERAMRLGGLLKPESFMHTLEQ